MDVLADVLAVTRFGNSTLCSKLFVTPWNLHFEAENRATFHIVSRGACWLMQERGAEPIRMLQGDVALLAHGDGHALGNDPSLPPNRWETRLIDYDYDQADIEGRECTRLFCGAYRFEQDGPHPILSLLPPVIHIAADRANNDHALRTMIELLMLEAAHPSPGAQIVIKRLMDVVFVYIVRTWLAEQPDRSAGWIGALRDAQVGAALAAIHEEPGHKWTVDGLAKRVNMSRAAFAKRFCALVGEAPLTYLYRWRMDLAAQLLREPNATVGQVSEAVGYSSETSFSKAFSKSRGTPPGRYRFISVLA